MEKQFQRHGDKMKLFKLLSISLILCLSLVGVGEAATYYIDSAKGVDTATGTSSTAPVKTMVGIDKLMTTMKEKDILSITGNPIWVVQIGIDADLKPIYATKEGIIQYHLIPGGKMRTVVEIEKTRLIGTSAIGEKGEIETVIDKTEEIKPIDIKPIDKEVLK